jgi:hypothetical protein
MLNPVIGTLVGTGTSASLLRTQEDKQDTSNVATAPPQFDSTENMLLRRLFFDQALSLIPTQNLRDISML